MILFPIKLFYKTYWYEVSMNLTYWGILKKYGIFQSEELKSIKTEYEFLKKQNRNFIKDIQSEYHLAWCCLIHSVYLGCKRKNMALTDSIMLIEKSLFESMNAESISNYITRSLDKAKDPFEFMVKTAKDQEKKFFASTFGFSTSKDDENSYHTIVHNCMYLNYFQKHQVAELMQIACKWDLISWSKGIIPEKHKFEFIRPATLGLNHKNCEFNFDRK